MKKLLIFIFLALNLGNIYCGETESFESLCLDIVQENLTYYEKFKTLPSADEEWTSDYINFEEVFSDSRDHFCETMEKYIAICKCTGSEENNVIREKARAICNIIAHDCSPTRVKNTLFLIKDLDALIMQHIRNQLLRNDSRKLRKSLINIPKRIQSSL